MNPCYQMRFLSDIWRYHWCGLLYSYFEPFRNPCSNVNDDLGVLPASQTKIWPKSGRGHVIEVMWYESVPKTDPTKDVTACASIDSIKIIATKSQNIQSSWITVDPRSFQKHPPIPRFGDSHQGTPDNSFDLVPSDHPCYQFARVRLFTVHKLSFFSRGRPDGSKVVPPSPDWGLTT